MKRYDKGRRAILLGTSIVGAVSIIDALGLSLRHVHARELHADYGADVVVVGGGAAGLSAAVAAAEKLGKGHRVVVLEKNAFLGGDTLLSGGYFNAVDPARQEPLGIQDSVEQFAQLILKVGAGKNTPEVAHMLAKESAITLAWLEKLGMKFLPRVVEVYGSRWPRGHKPVMPRGTGYIKTLSEAALARDVRIWVKSPAVELLQDEDTGRIVGVTTHRNMQTFSIEARCGVILASGGFGANRSLIEHYSPQMAGLASDSQPGATGEMISAARAIGAKIENMEFVECVPGSPRGFTYPIRLDYHPKAMIFVNRLGERFVNELQGRREIADAVLEESQQGPCWCIAAMDAIDRFDPIDRKNLYRGLHAGVAWYAQTPEALARVIGVPESALVAAINEAQQLTPPRQFTRPPFWAVRLYMRIHTTMGGIATDEWARVLDRNGVWIPALWAAGQTTGSIHGEERIGGNGLAAACTFGRLAGIEAARNLSV